MELREIRDRLTVIETQFSERWSITNEKLDLLLAHRDNEEERKKEWMKESKGYTKQLVNWVLGIPIIIGSILLIVVNWKRIFPMILICLLLTGCVIDTKFYDKNNNLRGRIEQSQPGAAGIGEDDSKMYVDTRRPTFWEQHIAPILTGAANTTRESVNIN